MKFFKTLIAATLGTILALLIAFFIIVIAVSSTSREAEPYIQDNSILNISLSGSLPARIQTNPFNEVINPDANNKASLQTLKENLAKAQSQDHIKGVLLNIDFMSEHWANLQEAHKLISSFRDSSDKFIYAMTNDVGYNEKAYYLATAADSIFSPPETFFEFDGFYSQVMFLDGMFDKLGIKTEVTRHGKYKGAVEPFFRKDLSEANKYQLNKILEVVNQTFLKAVSKKSGKTIAQLNNLLNVKPHLSSEFGFENGLIDSLLYESEVKDHIKRRIGLASDASLNMVSNARYAKVSGSSAGLTESSASDKIAVIYANGPIMPDAASNSTFNSQQVITGSFIADQIKSIKNDDHVKAVVLRINSPGGAGSTSDLIWHKLHDLKNDMPVIVSMGNVAASGGYYIASAADSIVAMPTTITGSIGVFATKFDARPLFNDKLGITFDEVKTHKHADWLTQTRAFTPSEQKAFQEYVNQFYDTFVSRVAQGRSMSKDDVDKIGQGRVWTGEDAQKVGLADVMGDLNKSIEIAAQKAGLKDYKLENFPKKKSLYEMILNSAGSKVKTALQPSWFSNTSVSEAKSTLFLIKRRGALTVFPYNINIQ